MRLLLEAIRSVRTDQRKSPPAPYGQRARGKDDVKRKLSPIRRKNAVLKAIRSTINPIHSPRFSTNDLLSNATTSPLPTTTSLCESEHGRGKAVDNRVPLRSILSAKIYGRTSSPKTAPTIATERDETPRGELCFQDYLRDPFGQNAIMKNRSRIQSKRSSRTSPTTAKDVLAPPAFPTNSKTNTDDQSTTRSCSLRKRSAPPLFKAIAAMSAPSMRRLVRYKPQDENSKAATPKDGEHEEKKAQCLTKHRRRLPSTAAETSSRKSQLKSTIKPIKGVPPLRHSTPQSILPCLTISSHPVRLIDPYSSSTRQSLCRLMCHLAEYMYSTDPRLRKNHEALHRGQAISLKHSDGSIRNAPDSSHCSSGGSRKNSMVELVFGSKSVSTSKVLGQGVVGRVFAGWLQEESKPPRPVAVKLQISHFDLALREIWAMHRLSLSLRSYDYDTLRRYLPEEEDALSPIPTSTGQGFRGPKCLVVYRFRNSKNAKKASPERQANEVFTCFLTSPWTSKSISMNEWLRQDAIHIIGNEWLIVALMESLFFQMAVTARCGMIHADIKVDNVIVVLQDASPPPPSQSTIPLGCNAPKKGASNSNTANSISVLIPFFIDWGRSIDTTVEPFRDVDGFIGQATIEPLQPLTARQKRPWGYDLDAFAVANLVAVTLSGRLVGVQGHNRVILPSLPRHLRYKSIWKAIIRTLATIEHDPRQTRVVDSSVIPDPFSNTLRTGISTSSSDGTMTCQFDMTGNNDERGWEARGRNIAALYELVGTRLSQIRILHSREVDLAVSRASDRLKKKNT